MYIGLFNKQLAEDIGATAVLRFERSDSGRQGRLPPEDLMADRTQAIVGFERSLRRAIDAYIASLGSVRPLAPVSCAPFPSA
jgi:hypothetical protein